MLLSRMPNSSVSPDGNFNLTFKNGKAYFNKKGDPIQVIGNKQYPVGKRPHIFAEGLFKEGEKYPEIVDILKRSNWEFKPGYCYSNADILYQIFNKMGIDAKYYSGWVFSAPAYPIHHAWVVVEDAVYDISIHMKCHKLMLEQVINGVDNYSKEALAEIREAMKTYHPVDENFSWGKVHETMIYIGAESDPQNARLQYNKAIGNDISKHPSYRHMKKNSPFERSRYQKLLMESK